MQRREFIKDSGVFALGIGVFGHIRWQEDKFMGDTPTTTDILGPFYRPSAPFRTNLNPPGFKGEVLHLSGTVFKEDGKTSLKDCLIEIWQCQQDTLYDNVSDEFRYRASQKTDKNGNYRFTTAVPIPYAVEDNPGAIRPAHIHMRLSAKGQQDLITQIYLTSDPHTDPSTKSNLAVNRILTLKQVREHENELRFDLVLRKEYLPDDAVFHKVSGVYKMNDQSKMEFYRNGNLLFYKTNNQILGGLSYSGDNTFVGGVNDTEARFELLPQGKAKVWFRFSRRRETKLEGEKIFVY